MELNTFKILMNSKPFIVAELSANHNGSIARAYDIIDAAHAAGADVARQCPFHIEPGIQLLGGFEGAENQPRHEEEDDG